MSRMIILAILAGVTVTIGNPISPVCSPFLWNTVGNHDSPLCVKYDDSQILRQLHQIKDYYSELAKKADIMSNTHMKELMNDIGTFLEVQENLKDGLTRDSIVCTGCKSLVELLRYYSDEGKSDDDLKNLIADLCTEFKVQSPPVCQGIANVFGPEILHIINVTTVKPIEFCQFLLGDGCGEFSTPEWEIELPPSTIRKAVQAPPNDGPRLKVLHIADTHFDRYYAPGSKVDCTDPLCCRLESGVPAEDEKIAGKWGDWRCDTPEITLDSMLQHAAATHPDIDYIIWTGDLPAHDVWKNSETDNVEVLKVSVAKIIENFPNISVFPAVGNHESVPSNSFPPPTVDWPIAWLYDQFTSEWGRWLPDTTSETIKKGAYYTALARPGLRIVSLNTNYCYHSNWWLVLNSFDPADQLKWLVDVLKSAEDNNEKVHILAHIPPGQNDCLDVWRNNYYRIVSRFQNTIGGQFFGHTHKDEFEIYYDVADNITPVSIGFIAPGVTTYTNLNPGYRILYVDGDRDGTTRTVVDHEAWVFDLEKANENGEAEWYKSYTAKEEYNMESLLPEDWHKLYERFKTDEELFQKYYSHYYKESPQRGTCDESCKRGRLCAIRSCRRYGDPTL